MFINNDVEGETLTTRKSLFPAFDLHRQKGVTYDS